MVSWCLLYFTTKSLKEKVLPGHEREGHLKQSRSGGRTLRQKSKVVSVRNTDGITEVVSSRMAQS